MKFKLNRPDFCEAWGVDPKKREITESQLNSLGFTKADIDQFISWGYLTPIK